MKEKKTKKATKPKKDATVLEKRFKLHSDTVKKVFEILAEAKLTHTEGWGILEGTKMVLAQRADQNHKSIMVCNLLEVLKDGNKSNRK